MRAGRRLFEHLSTEAAKRYVQGEALRFGFPREEPVPSSFPDAIDFICEQIQEGRGFKKDREQYSGYAKDDGVDVVAWNHFPDHEVGKIVLFGSCAAGRDWEDKLGDLCVDRFGKHWFRDPPPSPVVRVFFVPHCLRLPKDKMIRYTYDAGIIFDRCRISYWAEDEESDLQDHQNWVMGVLQEVREQ